MNTERAHTILYIEDNRANQLLVQLILERRQGIRLITAGTGAEGLKAVSRECPDMVLLDISLPDMDGYTVLETLRNDPATKDLPIVAISGDLPSSPAQSLGFTRCLKKPIEIAPLFQALDELLPSS